MWNWAMPSYGAYGQMAAGDRGGQMQQQQGGAVDALAQALAASQDQSATFGMGGPESGYGGSGGASPPLMGYATNGAYNGGGKSYQLQPQAPYSYSTY